jgi:hypothetical protein
MNSSFIGIDPGKKGAICLIDSDGKVQFWDLSKYQIDEALHIIKATYGMVFTVVEKQQSMPGQGSVSGFTTGYGYGSIITSLRLLKFPFVEVRSNFWQKGLGLPPSSKNLKKHKEAILKIATQLFPEANFYGPKGGHLDGRSDAALIADYARRRNNFE